MGEVGDGAVLDLARLAIGLAQQVARVGLAVQAGGRAVDEHYDYEYAIKPTESQYNATIISGYLFRAKRPSTHRSAIINYRKMGFDRGEHPFQQRSETLL